MHTPTTAQLLAALAASSTGGEYVETYPGDEHAPEAVVINGVFRTAPLLAALGKVVLPEVAEERDPTPVERLEAAGYTRIREDDLLPEHIGREGAMVFVNDGLPGHPILGTIDEQYHPRTGQPRRVLTTHPHHQQQLADLLGEEPRDAWVSHDTTIHLYIKD